VGGVDKGSPQGGDDNEMEEKRKKEEIKRTEEKGTPSARETLSTAAKGLSFHENCATRGDQDGEKRRYRIGRDLRKGEKKGDSVK